MLRKSIRFLLIFVLPVSAALVFFSMAFAHGSVFTPLSRVFGCYLENPESPDTLPCQDLVNMSGTQPLYDWNEVNIRDAGDNTRSLVPDGHICSAGRSKYYGLDQARADWPVTTLPAGGSQYTFQWSVTANHPVATFYFYVTKDGYNPTVPLKWSDLEPTPFLVQDPTLVDVGQQYPVYQFTTTLPNKTGRHLIYVQWIRHDSLEDFYSCSDVWFGSAPKPTSTPAPACTAPEWVAGGGGNYVGGSIVSHNNKQWMAKWTNSDEPSTTGTSSAWKLQANCTLSGSSGTPLPTATFVIPPSATAGPSPTPCVNCGPTNTPFPATLTPTRTRTNTPGGPTATPTRTATRTNTPGGPTPTRTRTNTPGGPAATATRTATRTNTPSAGTCSPVNATITAPFAQNGTGTFCWQSSNLGSFINSWNMAGLTINGTNYTNLWATTSSLPAKIGGFWYISYTSTNAFSHFEAQP